MPMMEVYQMGGCLRRAILKKKYSIDQINCAKKKLCMLEWVQLYFNWKSAVCAKSCIKVFLLIFILEKLPEYYGTALRILPKSFNIQQFLSYYNIFFSLYDVIFFCIISFRLLNSEYFHFISAVHFFFFHNNLYFKSLFCVYNFYFSSTDVNNNNDCGVE